MTFADVLTLTCGCSAVVADMPIGLPSAFDWPRACDVAAKTLLAETSAAQKHRAVNPHARSNEDMRTPEELLALIAAKGLEVADALARLRALLAAPARTDREG